jgi:Predicted membrane protein
MTKEHFLQELAARLHQLSAEEQEKVVAYYSEMISDRVENGNSEEAVIQDLGAPETIAQQICADHDKAAETMPPQTFSPEAGGERCYAAADSVQKIVVSAQNVHVNVRSVPSGSVRVLFDPLPNDKVTVTENGGVFTFTQTMQFHLFSWFGLFRSHYGITLEIPESFSGDVCVSTCNARLTAEHLRQLKSTEFVTDNARIVMSGLECETLRVRTSNGKVELENCSGTVCTVKTNNARITALNCSFSEGVDFHTENDFDKRRPYHIRYRHT